GMPRLSGRSSSTAAVSITRSRRRRQKRSPTLTSTLSRRAGQRLNRDDFACAIEPPLTPGLFEPSSTGCWGYIVYLIKTAFLLQSQRVLTRFGGFRLSF